MSIEAMALNTKLRLSWTGDYEYLKQFVNETLQLNSTWSQPGGDKKVYTFGDSRYRGERVCCV